MPREKLLLAFEAGHFAGVEDMKKSERLFNRVAPMGVNDIMMAVQYRTDPSLPPLNIPLIVFDGSKDNTIPRGYMKGWRKHTTGRYRHVYIPGTHYFVSTHYREVTSLLAEECLGLMEGMRGGIMGQGHSWVADVKENPAPTAGAGAVDAAQEGEAGGAAAPGRHAQAMAAHRAVLVLVLMVLMMGAAAAARWWMAMQLRRA